MRRSTPKPPPLHTARCNDCKRDFETHQRGAVRCLGCNVRRRDAAAAARVERDRERARRRAQIEAERDAVNSELSDIDRATLARWEPLRPRTRGDCVDGPRPCPWASCRHHLGIEVDEKPQTDERVCKLTVLQPDGWRGDTCALDVADRSRGSGRTLEEVADVWGITRERVRQIEAVAMRKLHRALRIARERGDV
jgi:hypothetical protein